MTGLYAKHVNNKKVYYLRNGILAVLLLFMAGVCLFPLIYMILNSFGPAVEAAGSNRSILPAKFTLDSYKAFFAFSPFSGRWLVNSFVSSISQVVGNVIFASMAGYAFAKLEFKGRNALFLVILSGMMMPVEITTIPLFIALAKIGLVDSHFPMIVPQIFGYCGAFGVFLMRQFFITVPSELMEAGKIDGCSQPRIFVRIMLPMATSIIATLVIFTFLPLTSTIYWCIILINLTKYQILHNSYKIL